jgi:imidazole glycerol phosphate synthase glutamine amidotransferase subunit
MPTDVVVIPTGTANLASVLAGLSRADAAPRLAGGPRDVADADAVVLPGVGALAAAMARLHAADLVAPLRDRIAAGRPTLAVCLGLQLLAERSDESPGVPALAVVPGTVRRLPDTVRVPQMGWNRVEPDPGCRFLSPGWAWFANSFCLPAAPTGWAAAWAEHGGPFVAAMEKGPLLACQFHPELSGAWGAALLERWVRAAAGGGA